MMDRSRMKGLPISGGRQKGRCPLPLVHSLSSASSLPFSILVLYYCIAPADGVAHVFFYCFIRQLSWVTPKSQDI